ncbi:MAG: hypothetical protein ACI837_002649 [Crocinitomicaceae bacterium]|jgi:hypothetical protein
MNIKKWSWGHTIGGLLGLLTPLLVAPLVLLFLSYVQEYYFEMLWSKFANNDPYRIKILTIAIIANLIWFYVFLNRKKYDTAMGVILGSVAFAPYVVYVKFF